MVREARGQSCPYTNYRGLPQCSLERHSSGETIRVDMMRNKRGERMEIVHDMYNEIVDITRSRQYKFTMHDDRVGYFNVDYREIGSQDSGDFDIHFENVRDMRWADGTTDDLPTLEQISEVLGAEVKA